MRSLSMQKYINMKFHKLKILIQHQPHKEYSYIHLLHAVCVLYQRGEMQTVDTSHIPPAKQREQQAANVS